MRGHDFITLVGGPGPKKPVKLVAAAILCLAGVYAEAADIRDGDTGYVAKNSIWFTDESDLSVWKRVRKAFAPKDVKTYQQIILGERQAWQFSGPIKVKVISYWANEHEINVKMLTEGRLADSEWWVEDKDYTNAAANDSDICGAQPPRSGTIAACRRIIASPNTSAHDRGLALASRADAMRGQGDMAGAIADYTQALTLLPDYVPALDGRGTAYRDLQKYDLALRDLAQAIGLKPDEAELYNSRGITYRVMGDPARAVADFDRAIQLAADYPIAFNNRGNAYADLKQPDRAIADFDQAIKLSPIFAEAFYNRGNVESNIKGDYDKAIADFSAAIKFNPKFAEALVDRGVAYGREKNIKAALSDFAAAIKLNPNYALAYRSRGILYFNTGDNVDAVPTSTRPSSLIPRTPKRCTVAVLPSAERATQPAATPTWPLQRRSIQT